MLSSERRHLEAMEWADLARIFAIPSPDAFPAAAHDQLGSAPRLARVGSLPWCGGVLVVTVDRMEWHPTPTALAMVGDLARTAARAISGAIIGGPAMTTEEVLSGRQAACAACDRLQGARCSACGCIVAVKVRVAASRCPLGRWPSEQSPS